LPAGTEALATRNSTEVPIRETAAEILERVVGQLRVEVRIDRQLPDIGDEQRIAVGWSFRHGLGAGDAAGTRPVLHQHLLAERLAELRRDDARHGVGQAAGHIGHDEADRLRGPVLCRGRTAQQQRQQGPGSHGRKSILAHRWQD
jgi:hypothetical protein